MNTKKILNLLIILSLFSIFSFIIANSTYKNLDQRVQTIYLLQPDFFTLEDDIPFNFRQELFTSVSKVRFGEFKNKETNHFINCNKIPKKNGYRPISIDSEYDQYKIELIGQNVDINENCIKSVLKVVSTKFHNNVKKKIEIIKSNKIFLLEILNRSNKPNIDRKEYNLISASKIINLIEINRIKSAILGNNYLTSIDERGMKYLSFINEEVKEIIIDNLIDKQIKFSIVSPIDSVTDNYKIEIERTLIKDNLSVRRLESLLKNRPFKIYSVDSMYIKIPKKNYIFSILILMNIIGLIIFIILNKNYFKKFYKKFLRN